jgi:hypothetical protein
MGYQQVRVVRGSEIALQNWRSDEGGRSSGEEEAVGAHLSRTHGGGTARDRLARAT